MGVLEKYAHLQLLIVILNDVGTVLGRVAVVTHIVLVFCIGIVTY